MQELEQNDGSQAQAIDQEKFDKMMKMLLIKQKIREDVLAEMAERDAHLRRQALRRRACWRLAKPNGAPR